MQDRLISVIIPTLNRPHFLKQAIDSVIAQTYRNFEIIIIDDGSTDETKQLAENYGKQVKYFYQSRKGVSAARNKGIEIASGEFVAFLDDDDIFTPDKLENNIIAFDANPEAVMICSGFRFIDKDGNKIMRGDVFPEKEELNIHDIAVFTLIHTSSVVVRHSALKKTGGFPVSSKISEDYHMWKKFLMHDKGYAIPKILTYFRQHEGNTKLPARVVLKENTNIIKDICKQKPGMQKSFYIKNLHRIISMNLSYKKKRWEYFCFNLKCFLTNPVISLQRFYIFCKNYR